MKHSLQMDTAIMEIDATSSTKKDKTTKIYCQKNGKQWNGTFDKFSKTFKLNQEWLSYFNDITKFYTYLTIYNKSFYNRMLKISIILNIKNRTNKSIKEYP